MVFITLNIIILGLVLLIAYWWANQGLFSAILHLMCVVAAGAITFGVWEPLTEGLLLHGNAFDRYAWGVSFVGVFAVSLFLLRLAFDKLAPGNVHLPHWVNLVCGTPVGAASGILTIGMVMIGCGFIQSSLDVMGFVGYARSGRTGSVEAQSRQLWVPVHQITDEFFSLLSVNSLYPTFQQRPLRHVYPDLYKQSAALQRDSYQKGRGQISMPPDGASVQRWAYEPTTGLAQVEVLFTKRAQDYGDQLTLSASQVRLIEKKRNRHSKAKARTLHPTIWTQDRSPPYAFDSRETYATSTPAQQTVTIKFAFPPTPNFEPGYIQIKGVRYALPPSKEVTASEIALVVAERARGGSVTIDPSAPDIQSVIEISKSIRPISANTNSLPGGIKVVDKHLASGKAEFPRRGGVRASRNLRIAGILEPLGARVVKVDVSRRSPANLFDSVRERISAGARIELVDRQGRTYPCIGYMWEKSTGYEVKLDPANYVATIEDIPILPRASSDRLRLIFLVTENATLIGLRFGDVSVGRCDLLVPPKDV